MSLEETLANPVLPNRPRYGWLAWLATVGYIAAHHSPDVLLQIECRTHATVQQWSANLSWGQAQERVDKRLSLAQALGDLWQEVERVYDLLPDPEALAKRPVNYADHDWLDERTNDVLERLIAVTATVFSADWQIIILYQPVESADVRVQARLIAQNNAVHRSGRGATLRDACRALYQNSTGLFTSRVRLIEDDET